jgi:hypothetical protein
MSIALVTDAADYAGPPTVDALCAPGSRVTSDVRANLPTWFGRRGDTVDDYAIPSRVKSQPAPSPYRIHDPVHTGL